MQQRVRLLRLSFVSRRSHEHQQLPDRNGQARRNCGSLRAFESAPGNGRRSHGNACASCTANAGAEEVERNLRTFIDSQPELAKRLIGGLRANPVVVEMLTRVMLRKAATTPKKAKGAKP